MKFPSHELALHLDKSTICPCMEYCCHIWASAPSCYLESLDKLQKRICRTVGPSLALVLNPWLIVKMWPAYVCSVGITLVGVLQNWLNLFHFLFLEWGLLVILIDCVIFLSSFLDVTRVSMATASLLAQLQNPGILCL